jgi:hypothetical protein
MPRAGRCFSNAVAHGSVIPWQHINLLRYYADWCNFRSRQEKRYQKWKAPILDAPEGRRDDFVLPIL